MVVIQNPVQIQFKKTRSMPKGHININRISSGKDVLEDINGAVKEKDHFTPQLKPALNMYLP